MWTLSGWSCTSPSTLFEFQTDPFLLVPLIGVGLAYAVGTAACKLRHTTSSYRTRGGLFAVGYAALLVALISPLHAVGEQYFSVHMVQHLLLSLVAPPLLLLSNSMPVCYGRCRRRERTASDGSSASPARSFGTALADPPGGCLDAVRRHAVGLAYAPGLRLGARKPLGPLSRTPQLFRDGGALLVAGDRLRAAAQPPGLPGALAYTFLAWMPNSLLGAGLTLSRGALYPHYVQAAPRRSVPTPWSTSNSPD